MWCCNECFPQTVGQNKKRERGATYEDAETSKRKCFLENMTFLEFTCFWIVVILILICIIYTSLMLRTVRRNSGIYREVLNLSTRFVCHQQDDMVIEQKYTNSVKQLGLEEEDKNVYERMGWFWNEPENRLLSTNISQEFPTKERLQFSSILRLTQTLVLLNTVEITLNDSYDCQGTFVSSTSFLTTETCANSDQKYVYLENNTALINKELLFEMDAMVVSKYPLIVGKEHIGLKLITLSSIVNDNTFAHLPYESFKYHTYGSLKMGYHIKHNKSKIRLTEVDIVHPFYCRLAYERLKFTINETTMTCVVFPTNVKKPCSNDLLGSVLFKSNMIIAIYFLPNVKSCGTYDKPYVFNNIKPIVPWLRSKLVT